MNNSRVRGENTPVANNGTEPAATTPIYVQARDSSLTLTGNTFTGQPAQPGAAGIRRYDRAPTCTLVAEEGLESYELDGDFTVPLGITMTVEPGVMVMARDTTVELNVQGHLASHRHADPADHLHLGY